jgi:nucleotide-binding universal stress UspA family protein
MVGSKNKNMKKFKKLLIALDQSELSENIMNYGKTLARRYKADITLLHIVSSEIRYEEQAINEVDNDILPSPPSVKSAEVTYLQAYKWLESMAPDKDISTEIKVLVALDSVPAEILNYAEKNKADLIILGTRGKKGPEKVLLGSVASYIGTYAQCPVLVVR